jgi:hypothetical protein
MEEEKVKKWIHDLNNRVGVVLANAELLQMDKQLSPKALERSKMIEAKSLEIRQFIAEMKEHLFG